MVITDRKEIEAVVRLRYWAARKRTNNRAFLLCLGLGGIGLVLMLGGDDEGPVSIIGALVMMAAYFGFLAWRWMGEKEIARLARKESCLS